MRHKTSHTVVEYLDHPIGVSRSVSLGSWKVSSWKATTWIALLFWFMLAACANAQDRIFYGPALPRPANAWNPHLSMALEGSIEKLNGQFVEFIDGQGNLRKLPSDRIERIEVDWDTEASAAAHQRFVERQYVQVLRKHAEILRSDSAAQWQLVILLGEIVESFEAIGKPESAGKYFLLMTQQSPPDFLLAMAPLNWTSRETTATIREASMAWLADKDPWAQLLGASWLLLTDKGEIAKETLQRLQGHEEKTLAKMAAVQLWRAVPPPETTGRMLRWFEARDSLSLPMQLGPSEFLAERMSRIDRTALATGEWLRIGAQFEHHPYRAGLALEAAAERITRNPDAPSGQAERVSNWRRTLGQSLEQ